VQAAAVRLFERQGYRNTTIDDIARELGTSKPTVYAYAKTKGWLLESVFAAVVDRLKADLTRITASDLDPGAAIREAVHAHVRVVTELQPHVRVFFAEEVELPRRTRTKVRQSLDETTGMYVDVLTKGMQEGVFRSDVDPHVAAYLVTGMLNAVARWYSPTGSLSPDEIAEEAIRILEGFLLK
jgi:AcrR family transcriptional regulator